MTLWHDTIYLWALICLNKKNVQPKPRNAMHIANCVYITKNMLFCYDHPNTWTWNMNEFSCRLLFYCGIQVKNAIRHHAIRHHAIRQQHLSLYIHKNITRLVCCSCFSFSQCTLLLIWMNTETYIFTCSQFSYWVAPTLNQLCCHPHKWIKAKELRCREWIKKLACEHAPTERAWWKHLEVRGGAWGLKWKSKGCCDTYYNKWLVHDVS